jgi:branched-chain amino acid transport system ATP-binding protein
MTILETKGLRHDFSGLQVLMGVDLEVRQGERHAIIGPNGAGKTTLFNVITGAYRPSQGRVIFKGRDVTGFRPHTLARMGMGRSFQITSTFQKLTAFENMRMPVLSRRGIRFNLFQKMDNIPEITAESERTLDRFNLLEQRDVRAGLLSYGNGRGLEVGLAMAADAELVMLDEPAAGMSKEETRHMVDLIRRLTEGKTVVIIEHDMDMVFSLADRITVLHHGAVLASGPPDEIRRDEAVKEAYLGHGED